VTALLRHGADRSVKDSSGRTARDLATNDTVRAVLSTQ
jgi:hypothetical protein